NWLKGEFDMSKKNKPMRAKLIANPGAGNVLEAASRYEQVTSYLKEAGVKVDVAFARPKKEAIPIAKRAVKEGYDVIIAMGGDGTIGAVIRGIAGSKARLGIIPAGTENDIARALGIPEDLKEACAIIASGNTRKVDLGCITTKNEKNHYFFMMIAIGLTATLYPMVNDVPNGKFGGVMEAIKTILKYKPNPTVNLTLDDDSKIEVETMLVTITNTPVTGIKNLVAPDASMEDGLLDISVYPGFSKAELLNYFIKTANEGTTPDGRIQRYRAKKIKVKTSPKLDISSEGIIVGKGTAWIKLLPGAMRVIAPEVGAGAEKPQEKDVKDMPAPVSPVAQ
ncbi:MAG TPA: diacylglycerol kinase family protein, partial [Anaerolineales bacterium]